LPSADPLWNLWYRNYRFHRTAHRSRNGLGGMDRGPSGPHPADAFVAFVDSIYKSYRTTRCGNNAPAGMDRGPAGPHESCATFRTQRVDMQGMWRQGSLRPPGLPLRRLLIPRIRASVWENIGSRSSYQKVPAVASSVCRMATATSFPPKAVCLCRRPRPRVRQRLGRRCSPGA